MAKKKKSTSKKKKTGASKKVASKSTVTEIDIIPIPKAQQSKTGHLVGTWSFVLGFVIALIAGFSSYIPLLKYNDLHFLLIIAGIIIGFLNVRNSEISQFLIAGIGLVLVSYLGSQTVSRIQIYGEILYALQTLFVPATIIVALRSLFQISHK